MAIATCVILIEMAPVYHSQCLCIFVLWPAGTSPKRPPMFFDIVGKSKQRRKTGSEGLISRIIERQTTHIFTVALHQAET